MYCALRRTRSRLAIVVAAALLLGACGGDDAADDGVLRIYTSVTQDTVDAVVAGFQTANPDAVVEVFRAPTGELTARIAAEEREGGIRADVLWLTDPLSIQQYDRDGMLRNIQPSNAAVVPEQYRTNTFYGTRILNMVMVAADDTVASVADWKDLTTAGGAVAIPDPGFAGSAFGALAFFALDPAYGIGFYEGLSATDSVQVRSPGDVVAGVADGLYVAGMSLDRTVRSAVEDGSPVELIWPSSGAIAIYSPIAVVDANGTSEAEAFVDYVLGVEAQTAIAATGWEPVRDDVGWADSGPQLDVDWASAFDRQEELLDDYEDAFEG